MVEHRYPHRDVYQAAQHLVRLLEPACMQIVIAGSLRRGRAMVKDIEIVAAPKPAQEAPRFGDRDRRSTTALDRTLEELEQSNTITRNVAADPALWKWGPRYKKLAMILNGQKLPYLVDLFIVLPPAQWGPIVAIRTGPNDFNQAIMGQVLPQRQLRQVDGHLETLDGATLHTPTEASYFVALGIPLIPPESRKPWVIQRILHEVKPFESVVPAPEPRQTTLFQEALWD